MQTLIFSKKPWRSDECREEYWESEIRTTSSQVKQVAETEGEPTLIGVEAKVREERVSLVGRRGEEREAMELRTEWQRRSWWWLQAMERRGRECGNGRLLWTVIHLWTPFATTSLEFPSFSGVTCVSHAPA